MTLITLRSERVNTRTYDLAETRMVKLGVLLGVVDLQAKGYILNMTMHNGESGCCTCEEPGKSVKQGKGYARCYPYRAIGSKYPSAVLITLRIVLDQRQHLRTKLRVFGV